MTDLAWMKTYIGTETALTGHLTAEEFGTYERLRRHYWQHSGLPEDETRLIRVAGIEPERWPTIASAIRPLLAEALPRLDQERSEASIKREKKVAAGRKGAEARWQADSKPIADANGKRIANAMAEPMRNQWPSASASDEVRLGGKVSSYAGARTREKEPAEYAIDPPETVEQGRRFLEGRHVPPQDMEAKLTKLMAFRLYPSELEPYRRSAA